MCTCKFTVLRPSLLAISYITHTQIFMCTHTHIYIWKQILNGVCFINFKHLVCVRVLHDYNTSVVLLCVFHYGINYIYNWKALIYIRVCCKVGREHYLRIRCNSRRPHNFLVAGFQSERVMFGKPKKKKKHFKQYYLLLVSTKINPHAL